MAKKIEIKQKASESSPQSVAREITPSVREPEPDKPSLLREDHSPLKLDRAHLLSGIIFNEIIGRPKGRSRGRFR